MATRARPHSIHDVLEARAVRRRHRRPVDPFTWRFERALARIDRPVEKIVADYATSCLSRPVRRLELDRAVRWLIDDEVVLEFRFHEHPPATLVVHDFAIFGPITRALRTRHVRIRHATVREVDG